MKVGFDGVLLGAWTNVELADRILDIGTGTGLIALMLAQRTSPNTEIFGIDIDPLSVCDARDNFQQSPWKDRLNVERISLDEFADTSREGFDLAVCNPPYFSGIQNASYGRNLSRHSESLPMDHLFSASRQLLREDGRLVVIYPLEQNRKVQQEARHAGFESHAELRVRPLIGRAVHRILTEYRLLPDPGSSVRRSRSRSIEMAIEVEHHEYTNSFRELTRDFYLAF